MHNFITWYDILTVFIWTISIYTVIAVILLAISHFTEKMRNKKSGLPREKPQPKDRFKIVECSNKDNYKFQESRPEPPPPPLPRKTIQYPDANGMSVSKWDCSKVENYEHCQNYIHSSGKCTSFVCTKIVRFK